MDSIDKISSITKFSNALLNNISPDTLSNISNAMKVAVPAFKDFNHNIFGSNLYNDINNDFYKIFNDALQKTSLQTLDFFNSDTYKNIYADLNYFTPNLNIVTTDAHMNINLDEIKSLKYVIKKTVNELSEKDVYDDKDVEKVTDLSSYALQMALTNNCPKSVKRNLLKDLFVKIWKLMGIQQFAVILAIVFFVIQNIVPDNKPKKITINQTINAIIIIQKEIIYLNLRGITNNNTKLYLKPNTKSQTIFILDCGDIIEVIKIHKKWVYVRLYKTDIKGWVLKKYTKGPKFKKKDNLTIL